jgi:hypothetical protein
MFSGRKKDATVWQWFVYDEDSAKSTCCAVTKDGNSCGVKLAGKNPTNLKVNSIKCATLNRRKRDIWEKSVLCLRRLLVSSLSYFAALLQYLYGFHPGWCMGLVLSSLGLGIGLESMSRLENLAALHLE